MLLIGWQFIVGRRFYRAAWMGVKHGSLGMDALVRSRNGGVLQWGGAKPRCFAMISTSTNMVWFRVQSGMIS